MSLSDSNPRKRRCIYCVAEQVTIEPSAEGLYACSEGHVWREPPLADSNPSNRWKGEWPAVCAKCLKPISHCDCLVDSNPSSGSKGVNRPLGDPGSAPESRSGTMGPRPTGSGSPSGTRGVKHRVERDYLKRTIATVRNYRGADNCWPQWANIFADEIERLWKIEDNRLASSAAERTPHGADPDDRVPVLHPPRPMSIQETVDHANGV